MYFPQRYYEYYEAYKANQTDAAHYVLSHRNEIIYLLRKEEDKNLSKCLFC